MVFNFSSDPGDGGASRRRSVLLIPIPLDSSQQMDRRYAAQEGEEPELDQSDEDGDGGSIVNRYPHGGKEGGHQDLHKAYASGKAQGQCLKDYDHRVDGEYGE